MHSCVLNEDIGPLIKFIQNKIETEVNRNLFEFNLTGAQHEVLLFIVLNEDKKDVFQKDIEKCLKLTNPTVTGIVKRLEEKGLIERVLSEQDARYKCIHCTEKGNNILKKSYEYGFNNIEKKLLKGMSDAEKQELRRLLLIVLKNME